jgi:RNA polymerase sigma-70 factor (ECF subfamily)
MGELAHQYLRYLPAERRHVGADLDVGALDAALSRMLDEGRRAWPGIELEPGVFVRHLAERSSAPLDAGLHAGDLYLACACAHGVAAAVAAFDERYLARVPAFVARSADAREVADEVRQRLRQLLVVGEGDRAARIADYRGKGTLENWVRAAAARMALNLQRGERRQRRAVASAAAEARLHGSDPELDYVKRRYGSQAAEALRSAFDLLSVRERTLLRLHYFEHVAIGTMATSYGVHRATIGRWLLGAQRTLFDETRRLLQERLRLSPSECESLLGLLRSRMEVTVRALS